MNIHNKKTSCNLGSSSEHIISWTPPVPYPSAPSGSRSNQKCLPLLGGQNLKHIALSSAPVFLLQYVDILHPFATFSRNLFLLLNFEAKIVGFSCYSWNHDYFKLAITGVLVKVPGFSWGPALFYLSKFKSPYLESIVSQALD